MVRAARAAARAARGGRGQDDLFVQYGRPQFSALKQLISSPAGFRRWELTNAMIGGMRGRRDALRREGSQLRRIIAFLSEQSDDALARIHDAAARVQRDDGGAPHVGGSGGALLARGLRDLERRAGPGALSTRQLVGLRVQFAQYELLTSELAHARQLLGFLQAEAALLTEHCERMRAQSFVAGPTPACGGHTTSSLKTDLNLLQSTFQVLRND